MRNRVILAYCFCFILLNFCLPTHAAQPEGLKSHKKPSHKNSKSNKGKKKSTGRSVKKSFINKGKKHNLVKAKLKHRVKGTRSNIREVSIILPAPRDRLENIFVKSVNAPTSDQLELTKIVQINTQKITLTKLPNFSTAYRSRVSSLTPDQNFVQFSINQDLQEYAKQVVQKVPAPHVAVVAMEPSTGRILAMAGKSLSVGNPILHSGFPAASLIKVITAAAAIERSGVRGDTEIAYRGAPHQLGPENYYPNPDLDRLTMSVEEALGKSCNPVFSRIGLKYLNPSLFRAKLASFGFNSSIGFQSSLSVSSATVPNEDYEFGRTTAGFGDVYLSPVHAVTIMSAIANGGVLSEPSYIDQVSTASGDILYKHTQQILGQAIKPSTASQLLQIMTATTRIGTSKREFAGQVPWNVPGKTGTLKGENPKGLNNWFIGTAPLEKPRIAVAVVVVNPSQRVSKASHIAKLIFQRYLG